MDNTYSFRPHVPNCFEVDEPKTELFNTKQELMQFLNSKKRNNEIICTGTELTNQDEIYIITVTIDHKSWWVLGFAKGLSIKDFPNWKDKVIELYGSL